MHEDELVRHASCCRTYLFVGVRHQPRRAGGQRHEAVRRLRQDVEVAGAAIAHAWAELSARRSGP